MPRRTLALSLGIAFIGSAVLGVQQAVAVEPPPPTLTSEYFYSSDGTYEFSDVVCDPDGVSSFTVTSVGQATGPYPGAYSETAAVTFGPQDQAPYGLLPNPGDAGFISGSRGFGTGGVTSIEAVFSIDSPTAQIQGTKTITIPGATDLAYCRFLDDEVFPPTGLTGDGYSHGLRAIVEYEAVISTSQGVYRDSGTALLAAENLRVLYTGGQGGTSGSNFWQFFTSSRTEPALLLPTAKAECLLGNWASFGGFENQGDCISYVATQGTNEPGQNVPG